MYTTAMNTVTHMLAGLLVNDKTVKSDNTTELVVPSFLGGAMPDAPSIVMYSLGRVFGLSESQIWTGVNTAAWFQQILTLFSSIPLAFVALFWSLKRKSKLWSCFWSSFALHLLCDLATHHQDPYMHFFPFSDIRISSPVSYWDPNHGAFFVFPLELLIVVWGTVKVIKTDLKPILKTLALACSLGFFGSLVMYSGWVNYF